MSRHSIIETCPWVAYAVRNELAGRLSEGAEPSGYADDDTEDVVA